MPLRDHFRPPSGVRRSWEGLYGGWPALIVTGLNRSLSQRYVAEPRVHLGSALESDLAAIDDDGGSTTSIWEPPKPTLTVATESPRLNEYEVRVYDVEFGRRLVAAVELVSPVNKDRPERRRAFVAKCAALLQDHVSVTIVDLVTTRASNLYDDLLELFGLTDAAMADAPPLYAVACRWRPGESAWFLETWAHPLTLGQPLPTLPLWLTEDRAFPLELEQSYEETCRILRIP